MTAVLIISQTLASLASHRSNCMKRRVGALLVRSKRILSTGYNGTAKGTRNCNQGGCARCNGSARGGEARTSSLYSAFRPFARRQRICTDGSERVFVLACRRERFVGSRQREDRRGFSYLLQYVRRTARGVLMEDGLEPMQVLSLLLTPRCPCLRCSVKIVQCGVREVVYNQSYSMDEASARILKEGGVVLRQLHLPTDVQAALL